MYLKLLLVTCVLAFAAVVFSAYARLSDAGLGCNNWPACYEENALKQRQPLKENARREHTSWQWKVQNLVGALLGIMAISICGISWRQRNELRQSLMLPILLLALMLFLGVFGILAFSYLPRPVIVLVHLAGGIAMLVLLMQILLHHLAQTHRVNIVRVRSLYVLARAAITLVLLQIMLGGWVSSNFAGLACTEFPFCQGSLVPKMDFSYSMAMDGLPLSVERLTAIHWMHRAGAMALLVLLSWLSWRLMAVHELRTIGKSVLGLVVVQFAIGIFNVQSGLPLMGAVLHNASAMLLMVMLLILNYKLNK